MIPKIKLKHQVLSAFKGDGSVAALKKASEKWTLVVRNDQGNQETYQFDFLVVASGLHSQPYFPELKGKEKFRGQILHSYQVKEEDVLKGKKVMVVGLGKSGADLAVQVNHFSSC